MAAKNIQVNLLFQANTTAAKTNIEQLASLLHTISSSVRIGVDSGPIQQAINAAQQLQIHLNKAVNVDTGKLNLQQLNSSLMQSGQSLSQLTTQLQSAGTIGQQAFLKLATAIAHAEAPMHRTNAAVKSFGITLLNTVKWSIASKLINAIVSSFSSAVSHAKELNSALTSIGMVTGRTADSMARFAKEAKEAADRLNTTTTEYVKAALIFYQQGLSGDEVTERTDTVIKLAQVTGETAQEVSNQMTAIWNNFDDGSKSLEYYADVITKLGASTASSTSEISAALEKFAAIADTVGLSYEYAAASVATVVAETRQSAEVVGTAFKTIFARMEGLKLGETLEDGVDLNKYSQALASVGVNILDTSGQLKNMDDILNELGGKWQYFSKNTQVALAQVVGGVRQYNQVISLMSNWETVEENIELSKNATGELSLQQNIWSKSAEAASKRVKKAQDDLYENLIDDKLLISFQDIFSGFINGINGAIKAMGGLGPTLGIIIGLFSQKLMPVIQNAASSLVHNWKVATGSAINDTVIMQEKIKISLSNMMDANNIQGPMREQLLLTQKLITAKQELAKASKHMSEMEIKEAEQRMQVYEAMVAEAQASLELQAQLEKEIELDKAKLLSGDNKATLAKQSAMNTFQQKTGYSGEYVKEISEDATAFTSSEITAQHNRAMSSFATRREDIMTDPNLDVTQRTEKLKELEAVEEAQEQRYRDIIELQKQIGIEGRKSAEELAKVSVGRVQGLEPDEHLEKSGLDYGAEAAGRQRRIETKMAKGNNVSEGQIKGQQAVASKAAAATGYEMMNKATGSLAISANGEIDASVGNLEKLLQSMNSYSAQAEVLKTVTQELNINFDTQGQHIIAAVNSMDGYEMSMEEVRLAEEGRKAAVEALIAAEEKAAQAGHKDKAATEAVKKAKEAVKQAEEKLTKAQVSSTTQQSKLSKESQDYVKQLSSVKKILMEVAKSSSNSEKEMARINDIFNRLGKGGNTSKQAMKELQMEIQRLGKGSQGAADGIEFLANNIKNKLIESGMKPDEINAFIAHMEKMGAISPEVANKLRLIGDSGADMGNKVLTGSQLAINTITTLGTTASQLSMGISGIKAFINAFQEGNGPLETTMAILMSMSMILPLVAGGIKLVNGIKQASILLDAAEAIAKEKGIKVSLKKIATDNAEKVGLMALVIVKIFNSMVSKMGWVGAIAAIAVGAAVIGSVIALTAAYKKNTAAKLENQQAQAEQSASTAEAINKTQELSEAVGNLTEEYEKLINAGRGSVEVLDQMNEQIPELIQSYRDLADTLNTQDALTVETMTDDLQHLYNVAQLTGDYTEFNAQKELLDSQITQIEYQNARRGSQAAASSGATKMSDAVGGSNKGGKLTLNTGGSDATWAAWSFGADPEDRLTAEKGDRFEETRAQQILKNTMGDYYKSGIQSSWFTKTTANLEVDYNNTAEFVEFYERLQEAQQEMISTMTSDQLADSDIYREITDALTEGKEAYDSLVPLAKDMADSGGKLTEEFLKNGGTLDDGTVIAQLDISDVNTMQEYLQYRQDFIKVAKEEYGLTQNQIELYLRESEELSALSNEYALATKMLENFHGLSEDQINSLSNDQLTEYSNSIKEVLEDMFGEMSEEEMSIAVSIAATADNIDEFVEQMQQAMISSARSAYEASAELASSAMQASAENGKFNFSQLYEDENFKQYLEDINVTQVSLAQKSYEEQYRIVSEFYSKVSEAAFESYDVEIDYLTAKLASRQNELAAYYEAMNDETTREDVLAAQEAYAQKQAELAATSDDALRTSIQNELNQMEFDFKAKFNFDIDSNAAELQSEIDQILESIDQLQDRKIELAMDWSGVDEIERGMQTVANFAKTIQKDTRKVGNSYVMTAAQAREWLEVYPELGAIAKETTDGMIALNAAEVDSFIAGKDTELDAAIDTEIEQLKIQLESLEADLEIKDKEIAAAEALAQGELKLEDVSAQYLVALKDSLTQHFIDKGYEEQEAHILALQAMGMNEQQYTERVAELANQQATDTADAASAGATAQANALTAVIQRYKDFATFLVNNVGKVLIEIGAAMLDPTKSVGDVLSGYWDATAIHVTADTSGGGSDGGENPYEIGDDYVLSDEAKKAIYEAVSTPMLEGLNQQRGAIVEAISSVTGRITYLEALKRQDLADYGSTDPSGGGGKDKEAKDLLEIAERYHEITKEIETQERKLDALNKQKDRAFGKNKIKLMQDEQKELDKLYKKQEELLQAQSLFLALDEAAVKETFSNATFDKDGNISNYSVLKNQAADELNAARTAYTNSGQTDSDKKALEEAEKKYEDQVAVLDQYEETLEAWRDQQEAMTETAYQILDAKMEEIDYTVNLQIDFSNEELDYLEYRLKKLEDSTLYINVEYITNLQLQAGSVNDMMDVYKENIKNIFKNHGISEELQNSFLAGNEDAIAQIGAMDFSDAEVESLRTYTQGLMSTNEQLREISNQMHDKVLESFNQFNEKIDLSITKMETLKSSTDFYENIVNLIGAENFEGGEELLKTLTKTKLAQAEDMVQANKAREEMTKANLATARAKYESIKDSLSEEDKLKWEKTLQEMEKEVDASVEATRASITYWMEQINEAFTKEIQNSIKTFSETVAGEYKNLNQLQEAFNREKEKDSRYVEDYKKIYELSKLNRDIQKSIDSTDNVKAKQELADLQNEINALEKSGAEASEYQLENLRKKYDLRLAEIALEEAQNAKSTVRLTRDAEGNFGYVYTADEDKVTDAQQNYEDKLYAMQEHNSEYIEQMQEQIINAQVEISEAIETIMSDESLSMEERMKKVEEIQKHYQDQIEYYSSELNIAIGNNKDLYNDDWKKYSVATGYKISSDKDFVDDFKETTLSVLTGFGTMEEYQRNFNTASQTLLDDSKTAFETWQQETANGPLAAMETSFENLATNVDTELDKIETESDNLKKAIEDDVKDMQGKFAEITTAVGDWQKAHSLKISEMIASNNLLIGSFQSVLALWTDVKTISEEQSSTPNEETKSTETDTSTETATPTETDTSTETDTPTQPQQTLKVGDEVTVKESATHFSSNSKNKKMKNYVPGNKFYINKIDEDQIHLKDPHGPNFTAQGTTGWVKKTDLEGFDTGGYTGQWGPEGKLAMLHQKELVLNADDTENFLLGIQMLRSISDILEKNASLASMTSSNLSAYTLSNSFGQTLEQQVTIQAEFPNVSDHNEIEIAIDNLINRASQFAYKT